MENASKALLIAGAILLVIALIAVGMSIFGEAREVVDKSKGQIDNMKVQMHNRQFTEYEGADKALSEVKELVSVIGSNNSNNQNIVTLHLLNYTAIDKTGPKKNNGDYTNIASDYIVKYLTPGYSLGTNNATGSEYDVVLTYDISGLVTDVTLYRHFK